MSVGDWVFRAPVGALGAAMIVFGCLSSTPAVANEDNVGRSDIVSKWVVRAPAPWEKEAWRVPLRETAAWGEVAPWREGVWKVIPRPLLRCWWLFCDWFFVEDERPTTGPER